MFVPASRARSSTRGEPSNPPPRVTASSCITIAVMLGLAYMGITHSYDDSLWCTDMNSVPRDHSIYTNVAKATLTTPRMRSYSTTSLRVPTWDIDTIRNLSRDTSKPRYTAGILSSGGCCDTIAATLSGFRVSWGSEINEYQRAMFEHLTGAPSLGNTFDIDFQDEHHPDYISSGQDCTDYSSSGPKTGGEGDTGWQFTRQTDIINTLQPYAFKLEMVANALKVNKGAEVRKVVNSLVGLYNIKKSIIQVESHGDPSNRTRLFIVGIHKRLGDRSATFEFPKGAKGTAPHARELAELDEVVPQSHWVSYGDWSREHKSLVLRAKDAIRNVVGRLVKIGQLGEGMGHSSMPHAVYSWDGIFNTQTTYNGGGMRPPLSYSYGDPIHSLRKTTPLEACRIASLDDSYLSYARSFNDSDSFLYQCTNAGIPILTCSAIDRAVLSHLHHCDAPRRSRKELATLRDDFAKDRARRVKSRYDYVATMSAHEGMNSMDSDSSWGVDEYIRSAQMDSGSDASLGHTDLEPYLRDSKPSRTKIHMVDKTNTISCSREGILDAVVMNTSHYPSIAPSVPFELPIITVPLLNRELISFERYYREQGYSVHFDHHPNPCEMRKGESRIPFRYDWVKGNFWMDYIPFKWGSGKVVEKSADDGDSLTRTQSSIARAFNIHSYNVSYYEGDERGVMWSGDMGPPIEFTYGERVDDEGNSQYYVNYANADDGPIRGDISPYTQTTPALRDDDGYKCPLTAHDHRPLPYDDAATIDVHNVDANPNPDRDANDDKSQPSDPLVTDDPMTPDDDFTINVPYYINHTHSSRTATDEERYNDICTMVAHEHDIACDEGTSCKSSVESMHRNTYDPSMCKYIHDKCMIHNSVKEVIYADDVNMRETRGVKQGLRKKARLTIKDFHETHGHLGDCGNKACTICKAVGGCMRRIYKKVDPFKENRPGYSWVMDAIIFNKRSIEKHKYLIVIKDVASDAVRLLPIVKKSDAIDKVEEWIKAMRADPVYKNLPYSMVTHLKTDPAGEWRDDNYEWDRRIGEHSELGVKMEWPPPERHEAMGLAENAVWIVERCIKSILMEQNLPPEYWTRVSRDAEFLLNRFPVTSAVAESPLDGDRKRPLEVLTNGWYSRRQIDRELEYFVPTGTPCLVHCHKARGSTLGPKVRWGIASGMHRETCHFTCPFTKSPLFRSKSFVAYKLERGVNFAQFLGLKSLSSTRKSLVLPEDSKLTITNIITLPNMVETVIKDNPQIRVHDSAKLNDNNNEYELYDDATTLIDRSATKTKEVNSSDPLSDLTPHDTPTPIYDPKSHIGEDRCPSVSDEKGTPDPHQSREGTSLTPTPQRPPPPHESTPTTTASPTTHDKSSRNDDDGSGVVDDGGGKGDRGGIGGKGGEGQKGGKGGRGGKGVDGGGRGNGTPQPGGVNGGGRGNGTPQPGGVEGKGGRGKGAPQPDGVVGGREVGTPQPNGGGGGVKHVKVDDDTLRRAHGGHNFTKGPLIISNDGITLNTHGDGTVRNPDGTPYGTTSELGPPREVTSITTRQPSPKDVNKTGFDIDIMCDEEAWDKYEASLLASKSFKVPDDTTHLRQALKKLKLTGGKRDYLRLYREWLIDHSPGSESWCESMLPMGRGEYLEKGLELPMPTGRNWRVMLEEEDDRLMGDITSNVAIAYQTVHRWIKSVHTSHAVVSARGKKKKKVAILEKGFNDPKTLREAFALPDGPEWRDAAHLEFDTLTKMGVIAHGFTHNDLKKMGITRAPMHTSMALKYKTDVNGCIERRKVRMALAGHKGAMSKGIDYDDVFSPSPNQNTARLLNALLVSRRLFRKCWDIKLAYCNAPLYNNEMIAIRYPRDFERPDQYGRETFMVLKKNIYGHPAAGKQWADTRDAFIRSRFNEGAWSCVTSVYDPTLFYIRNSDINEEAWLSVYVDDCDVVGTSNGMLCKIFDIMKSKWDSREVPADYVLGVKREMSDERDEIEMTMTAYIDGVVSSFESEMNDSFWAHRNPTTPFEPHIFLERCEDDAEVKEVLGRGYQRLVGCLLWATRGCFPETSLGVHQLCRVMSCPSRKAWKEGLRILAWLRDHRTRGIKFNSRGNPYPISYSDASNKPDPIDGLSQYGNCIMWMGGPVTWTSKKLAHVGLSAYHNEYMALRHALSSVVWLRQLFNDIGLVDIVSEPTIMYGDNEAANKLTRQDFVSSGNQYIYLPYHYLKECVRMGMVDVRWVGTKLNFADIFTKAVPVEVLRALLNKLCGYDNSWYDEHHGAVVDPNLEKARREALGKGGLSKARDDEVSLLDVVHTNACHIAHAWDT